MSYIEGIGDEVTFLFLVLIIVLLLSVLWISTSVSDRPLIRVIVLDRSRLQEFLRRFTIRYQPSVTTATQHGTEGTVADVREDTVTPEPVVEEENALFDKPAESSTETAESSVPQLHPSVLDSFVSETLQSETSQSDSFAVSQSDTSTGNEHSTNTSKHDKTSLGATDNTSTNSHDQSGLVNQPAAENIKSSMPENKTTNETDTNQDKNMTAPLKPDSSTDDASSDASATAVVEDSSHVSEEILQDGHIRIRLKYLDERQRLVQAKPEETVGQFKRKHFSVELADNFAVRFIFRGQELREDQSTLQAYHVEDNSVIHCLMSRISQSEAETHSHQQQQQQQMDLSFLMFPLFALILGLIWYCRFTYRSYFSAVSTLSLIGITFLFLVALLASFRPGIHEHHD